MDILFCYARRILYIIALIVPSVSTAQTTSIPTFHATSVISSTVSNAGNVVALFGLEGTRSSGPSVHSTGRVTFSASNIGRFVRGHLFPPSRIGTAIISGLAVAGSTWVFDQLLSQISDTPASNPNHIVIPGTIVDPWWNTRFSSWLGWITFREAKSCSTGHIEAFYPPMEWGRQATQTFKFVGCPGHGSNPFAVVYYPVGDPLPGHAFDQYGNPIPFPSDVPLPGGVPTVVPDGDIPLIFPQFYPDNTPVSPVAFPWYDPQFWKGIKKAANPAGAAKFRKDILTNPETNQPWDSSQARTASEDAARRWATHHGLDPNSVPSYSPQSAPLPDTTSQDSSGKQSTDWPGFCDWASVVCEALKWFQKDPTPTDPPNLPTEANIDISQHGADYSSPLSSGVCPSPVLFSLSGQPIQYSYAVACSVAITYIAPLLVASSSLIAAMILIGI